MCVSTFRGSQCMADAAGVAPAQADYEFKLRRALAKGRKVERED